MPLTHTRTSSLLYLKEVTTAASFLWLGRRDSPFYTLQYMVIDILVESQLFNWSLVQPSWSSLVLCSLRFFFSCPFQFYTVIHSRHFYSTWLPYALLCSVSTFKNKKQYQFDPLLMFLPFL